MNEDKRFVEDNWECAQVFRDWDGHVYQYGVLLRFGLSVRGLPSEDEAWHEARIFTERHLNKVREKEEEINCIREDVQDSRDGSRLRATYQRILEQLETARDNLKRGMK